ECVREWGGGDLSSGAELSSRAGLSCRGARRRGILSATPGRSQWSSDPAEKIPRSARDDSPARDDRSARDDGSPRHGRGASDASPTRDDAGGDLPFELTNLKKVFWPEDGYTKGDLVAYYRAIAPWLLAYLRDRPVVLTRHPDGITGKSFFQKDAPGFAPKWIRTERMWSEDTQREIDYFVCDDAASLLYIITLG